MSFRTALGSVLSWPPLGGRYGVVGRSLPPPSLERQWCQGAVRSPRGAKQCLRHFLARMSGWTAVGQTEGRSFTAGCSVWGRTRSKHDQQGPFPSSLQGGASCNPFLPPPRPIHRRAGSATSPIEHAGGQQTPDPSLRPGSRRLARAASGPFTPSPWGCG